MASTSGSGLYRRPVNPTHPRPSTGGPLTPDVDPPPKPPRVLQLLAFGLLAFLACLQLFPATHFRHPADPRGTWVRFNSDQTSSNIAKSPDIERIHIFSWTDCMDLRMTAVLANSTLSNSRFPEHVYFHFFVPEGENEKLSYYKLKVLLPGSNLDIIGQREVKEKLRTALPELELLWPSLCELIPLVIPIIKPTLNRFIYVSPDTMIKGNIEELFSVDLGLYGIAAANNCSRRLGDYANIDVVNAIQRTAAKTWVSDKPYDKNDCAPDFNVLLLNAPKMDNNLMEAILWWSKVLNQKDERSNKIDAAVALALYGRYLKLPSVWKLGDYTQSKFDNETNILRYDGPARVCSKDRRQHQGSDTSNIWRQYFNPKSDAVLAH